MIQVKKLLVALLVLVVLLPWSTDAVWHPINDAILWACAVWFALDVLSSKVE
jgi:hypothetical protein